jgi:hypothetical protein
MPIHASASTVETFTIDELAGVFSLPSMLVLLQELFQPCGLGTAQLPFFLHPLRHLPCASKVFKLGIAAQPHLSVHLAPVGLKASNQLLKPCMANPKISRPGSTGRSIPPAGQPEEHKSEDHARFFLATPQSRRTPLRLRFSEISH